MTESLKTGAGRLPCESAPKIAPEPAKAPVIPPYSDLCTGADAVFSLIFLLVGWLYVQMIFSSRDIGFSVMGFTCLYIAGVEGYARSLSLAPGKESRFWLAVTALCGLSFFWSGEWAMTLFETPPDRWDLFGWKFLALTAAAVYWTLCRMDALSQRRTGSTLFIDLLRGFWVLPFGNFAARQACLHHRLRRPACGKKSGVAAGILLAVPFTLWAVAQLSAADEGFAAFFGEIFASLGRFFSFDGFFDLFVRLVMALLVGGYLFGLCFGAARKRRTDWPGPDRLADWAKQARRLLPATFCILLGAVSAVYLLFIVLQAQTLFAGLAGVRPDGFTYAEYARQGFFELCRVAAVNLSLCAAAALCCTEKPAQSPALRRMMALLCLLTLLLILCAGGRMALYISVYGFTAKRLLTSFFLCFLFLVFLAVIAALRRPVPMVRFAAFLLAAGFVLLCLTGPEYWMPRYNARLAPAEQAVQTTHF